MLSGTAHWGEVSLLSLGLFLGTTDRATAEIPPADDRQAVAAQLQHNQQISLLPGESASFWGVHRERPVEIVTNDAGCITRMNFAAESISFDTPLERRLIPKVLDNFLCAGTEPLADLQIAASDWKTSDGIVFFEKGPGQEIARVRTPRGIYQIESSQRFPGNEDQIAEARRLRGELIDDFDRSLPPSQRTEFIEAFARASLQARTELLSERIEVSSQQQRSLPYVFSLSEANLSLIKKIKSGEIAGKAAEEHLQTLEKIYSLDFREIIARSAVSDGNTFRQLLVCRLLNDRCKILRDCTNSQDAAIQSAAKSFKTEWERVSRQNGMAEGILRTGGTSAQFDQKALALEKILAASEEKLGVIPDSTLSRTDQRISQLVADLSQGASLRSTTCLWTLKPTDPALPACSYEHLNQGDTCLTFERDGERTIERWSESRKISETFLREGESGRRTNGYDRETGALVSLGIWKREGETLELLEYQSFRPDGSCTYRDSVEKGRCTFYDRNGVRIADLMHTTDHRDFQYRWIFSSTGEAVSTWDIEKLRRPTLTDDQYLKLLTQVLDTPERIYFYLDLCMTYTSDGINDKWQTPSQTIHRIENTTMRGDCEDYAFLAREILRRQGISAHVIYIPGHAECVWIEKDSLGRFHGRSLGTFGFDQNGVVYLKHESGPVDSGFTTARDALQALMKKYEKGGIGMPGGMVYQVDPQNVQLADFFGQQYAHQFVQGKLSQFVRD